MPKHPPLTPCWSWPVRRLTLSLLLVCGGHLAMLVPVQASAESPLPIQALPAPALANHYHPGLNLAEYWVSEKYDGVRALWDGQRLISRQGLPIAAPAWFTANWPAEAMDGELWAGRGLFDAVQSAVASGTPQDTQWQHLRYMVFDLPTSAGLWPERQALLGLLVAAVDQAWLQQVPQWQLASHVQLQAQLQQLAAQGAEGLMLRRANAPYRSGRSDDLIKLKTVDDAEAMVVGYVPGQGKYQGMTGALLVQMPCGQQFRLGSGLTDALRAQPPALGTVVSYRHNGWHASGLPRFARFWRVRAELSQQPAADGTNASPLPCSQ